MIYKYKYDLADKIQIGLTFFLIALVAIFLLGVVK